MYIWGMVWLKHRKRRGRREELEGQGAVRGLVCRGPGHFALCETIPAGTTIPAPELLTQSAGAWLGLDHSSTSPSAQSIFLTQLFFL